MRLTFLKGDQEMEEEEGTERTVGVACAGTSSPQQCSHPIGQTCTNKILHLHCLLFHFIPAFLSLAVHRTERLSPGRPGHRCEVLPTAAANIPRPVVSGRLLFIHDYFQELISDYQWLPPPRFFINESNAPEKLQPPTRVGSLSPDGFSPWQLLPWHFTNA